MNNILRIFIFLICLFTFSTKTQAQQTRPSSSRFEDPINGVWMGNYGVFRISEKLFWTAELHYRRVGTDNVPIVGRMGQVYNRHGIQYLFSKDFVATAGMVLRFDWSPDKDNDMLQRVIQEPRFWHEYLWVARYPRLIVYHRLRFEHRWSRDFLENSEYIFRNRYRYKFMMKIPLNNPKLIPGTFYFNPDVEIIMQSGKAVIDSPLEDLRLFPGLGFIYSPRVSFSTGVMYTTGQRLNAGYNYRQRYIVKINTYISLDFRKFESKIPDIRGMD